MRQFIAQKEAPSRNDSNKLRQVRSLVVENGVVQLHIKVQGRLMAKERIELFSEVQGVMKEDSKAFRSGIRFNKGEVLMRIDRTEALAALVSQRSQFINSLSQVLPDIQLDYPTEADTWKAYLQKLDAEKSIPTPPKSTNETFKLFLTARGIPSAYYNLQSSEVRFEKYILKAPFKGVLTDAMVNEGSLVRPGQALGSFIRDDIFELEAAIAPEDLPYVKVGMSCQLHSTEMSGEWTAVLKRINQKIDSGTQTVRIYFELKADDLKEGLYLSGELPSTEIENAFAVSRRLLIEDRYLFAIENNLLRRISPEIIGFTEELAIVRNVANGTVLLMDRLPGAYEGMQVEMLIETER
jgi:multidrug efflux pump subunit AcrA (membrane-fusion protein)